MNRRTFMASALSAAAITPSLKSLAAEADTGVTYLTPGSDAYASARTIFAARISLQPAVIALCTTEQGVKDALAYAAERNLPVAVKSGGHSYEGFCLNDGGMVIDVSKFKRPRFDTKKTNRFTIGPGSRLMDVNTYLLAKNRILPAGSCGMVGLAGLTLGGGYGFFAREHGLTCDHLAAVRMIDGKGQLHDSRDEPELLWACRGGGNGHFGIVTELQYETRPAPKQFAAYRFHAYKLEPPQSCEIAEKWFEVASQLPNDAFSALVLSAHSAFVLVTTHGPTTREPLTKALKSLATFLPKVDDPSIRPIAKALPSYYAERKPTLCKNGSGGFYKGYDDLRAIFPELVAMLSKAPRLLFQINTMGGAITTGEPSAYPHREYPFLGEWQSYWDKPEQGPRRIEAIGQIRDLLTKAGINRHYANYPDLAFPDWGTSYYGAENYARLSRLKKELDPDNRIQHPQSVRV